MFQAGGRLVGSRRGRLIALKSMRRRAADTVIATGGADARTRSQREQPRQMVTPNFDVSSADATAAAIAQQGGTVIVPKTQIPGVGWFVTPGILRATCLTALEAKPGSEAIAAVAASGGEGRSAG